MQLSLSSGRLPSAPFWLRSPCALCAGNDFFPVSLPHRRASARDHLTSPGEQPLPARRFRSASSRFRRSGVSPAFRPKAPVHTLFSLSASTFFARLSFNSRISERRAPLPPVLSASCEAARGPLSGVPAKTQPRSNRNPASFRGLLFPAFGGRHLFAPRNHYPDALRLLAGVSARTPTALPNPTPSSPAHKPRPPPRRTLPLTSQQALPHRGLDPQPTPRRSVSIELYNRRRKYATSREFCGGHKFELACCKNSSRRRQLIWIYEAAHPDSSACGRFANYHSGGPQPFFD